MAKKRYAVPDALWKKIKVWLPPRINPHPRGGGRKPVDDRVAFHAILFVLRTGCQWKALDATGLCSGSAAHRRFQAWAKAGAFHRLWEEGLLLYDEVEGIDWTWLSMDGAMTKAPLGGEKMWPQSHRPWQARRQKELADRYQRHSRGAGGGWGQPAGHQDGGRHLGQRAGAPACRHGGEAAALVPGQGV